MMRQTLLMLVLLAACGSSRPAAPANPQLLHKACPGTEDACGSGLSCMPWEECSIPASGSDQRTCTDKQTCEIKCSTDSDCPKDYTCVANNAPVDLQEKICDKSS